MRAVAVWFSRIRSSEYEAGQPHPSALRAATFPIGEGFMPTNPTLSQYNHFSSMATATSSATFIMVVKAFCRSVAEVSSPVRMWSLMVQMHRPRLP